MVVRALRHSAAALGLSIALPALVGSPPGLAAQLITVRTVPVAAGDQFLLYPSARFGMGGVSIAMDDWLQDPYVNPATGGRIERSIVFGAPVYSNVTGDDGDIRSLPVGVLARAGDWFGGFTAALQRIAHAPQTALALPGPGPFPGPAPLSSRAATNSYAQLSLGRRIASGIAVGASASYASLEAVDGVDLMYALSRAVQQNGHHADMRLGFLAEPADGSTFQLLLLRDWFHMTHDVEYIDWLWSVDSNWPVFSTRAAREEDRTHTWGAHVEYARPVPDSDWRAGALFTANWKSHPDIPNYEIMNIPRDPGDTQAFNVGVGLARAGGSVRFGIDLVYEPIWSDTWALAEDTMRTASGRLMERGERTVDNDFRFSNALIRMGAGLEEARYDVYLGLDVKSIRYDLNQHDRVQEQHREQHESWIEWTPSWSAAFKLAEIEVRYNGRVTTGTGKPGVAWTTPAWRDLIDSPARDYIIAPSGPLTLQEARVITHQLVVTLPLR